MTRDEALKIIAEFETAVREDEREGGTDSSEASVRVTWARLRDALTGETPHRAGTEIEADRAMLAQGEIPAHIANPVAPAHYCLAKGCTRKVRGLKSWCWQHADMQGHREDSSEAK